MRMCLRQVAVIVALLAGLPALAAGEAPRRILFVGNSFTLLHDVPGLVRSLAVDDAQPAPAITDVSVGGLNLRTHLSCTRCTTVRTIDEGGWDFVVLQDYSTRPTDSPTAPQADPPAFKADVTWAYDRIKAASPNAVVVLYETWARRENHEYYPTHYADRDAMQAQLNFHYHDAAENYIPAHATAADTGDAVVAPVGEAWRLNYQRENLNLYWHDDYHQGQAGAYLNALVLYATMYQRSTAGLTPLPGVTAEQAAYLQTLADQTTGIPEPGTLGLLSAGAAAFGRRRRVRPLDAAS